ncbi:MAG: hypothetical protein JWM44_1307 [Bacilli bacterium]|nr:hypothetical protein [Bacilli bacterium]
MNISESIKKVLNERNMTPSDLARMTGYTPQYMHEILSGKKRWNETTIVKTCGVLGLEVTISETKEGHQAS